MKRIGLVAAVVSVFALGLIGDVMAAEPTTSTAVLIVDVGTGASIGMGPGGMGGSIMTGGRPVMFDGQQFGTMMHSSMTATMQGMMGSQTLQHRLMSFELPGIGTFFGIMAGGSPWTGGTGMIIGGGVGLRGMYGTFTVGDEVGPNLYPFTFSYGFK